MELKITHKSSKQTFISMEKLRKVFKLLLRLTNFVNFLYNQSDHNRNYRPILATKFAFSPSELKYSSLALFSRQISLLSNRRFDWFLALFDGFHDNQRLDLKITIKLPLSLTNFNLFYSSPNIPRGLLHRQTDIECSLLIN